MFDIGMAEMVVIGVVALIVVGPKDLPMMFRKVGQFVGKARGMARDFQNAMNDAADQSGMKDLKKTFDQAADVKDLGLDSVTNSMKDYGDKFVTGDSKTSTDKSKTTAKKATGKKAPANKPAAKKPAVKKATAKTATTKTAATKTAAAKPAAAKKAPAKKSAAKKPAAKKPAAKKAT